jgi:hypothetical protein
VVHQTFKRTFSFLVPLLREPEAQAHGSIGASENDRLTFIATAEHARFVGSTNPCGLFAQLIRRRLWHFVTADDEERAQNRLKAHFYGGREEKTREASRKEKLSDDALFVALLQGQMRRRGFHGNVFSLLHAERPEWTRERWENAVAEIEKGKTSAQAHGLMSASDVATQLLSLERRREA